MGRKILVIDDERATLKMFTLILSAYGYETFTAENGEKGLEVFREETPDLVLTDIKMPIMDGIEVLTRIKQINPRAEVIVVTGHGDMDLTIKALNLDATDFINKPVQRKALSEALKRAEERLLISASNESVVEIREEGDSAMIYIRGSVDTNTMPYVRTAFAQAERLGKGRIIFAFNDNVSINGAGINTLADMLKDYSEKGGRVLMAGLSSNFKTVFNVVGIPQVAEMFDTKEQALAAY